MSILLNVFNLLFVSRPSLLAGSLLSDCGFLFGSHTISFAGNLTPVSSSFKPGNRYDDDICDDNCDIFLRVYHSEPGHPQQNGRHERMHLTLKKEATKPAAANFLQQQARFDKFIEVFNNERPHEALDMKCPVEVYQPSPRPYTGLPNIDYPLHDKTIVVTRCGRICLGRKKINFSQVFAGQAIGIKEVHDDIWLVSFMDYDLGYFDLETRVLEQLENPFRPKVLPMS